ncbi:MAG: GxxExxY protein [Pyrinomonadaceae bacterium]|nr:GxxExxY protein [Acidobacteriota bacterium]MBP7473813.1 GxxExxY protein [Pyrinomonadaceae bacterium]MBP9111077.1 GxxExxY protein [Pyrinomonadaceae bacterium]
MVERSRDELNQISGKIIKLAIAVHQELGPGMLEGAYEICLVHELVRNGLRVERQVVLPIVYQGITLDAGYRLDLVVEDCVIVEMKTVERLHPVHEAQLLSYLRMSDMRLGLLINFNVKLLRDGIKRVVNKF